MIYKLFIDNGPCCWSVVVVADVCEDSSFSFNIAVGFIRSLLVFDIWTWLALRVYGWTPFKR